MKIKNIFKHKNLTNFCAQKNFVFLVSQNPWRILRK
jgi:hypothetical protein